MLNKKNLFLYIILKQRKYKLLFYQEELRKKTMHLQFFN